MAGLGFKDFQVGEVLTSSDVDGYLMQQAVMNFADSGARGSALGTAAGTGVALSEGMVSYLQDTDLVEVYTGASWKPIGAILQVVSTTKTDTFSSTSTAYAAVTGLTATITPTVSSNKVLLVAQLVYSTDSTANTPHFGRLYGGNAGDYIGDQVGSNRQRSVFGGQNLGNGMLNDAVAMATMVYLDSPSTTSATTYGVEVKVNSGTIYVNRERSHTDAVFKGTYASSITAIEVAA